MNEPTHKTAEERKAEFEKKFAEWYEEYYISLSEEQRRDFDAKSEEEKTSDFLDSLSDEKFFYTALNLMTVDPSDDNDSHITLANPARMSDMIRMYKKLKVQADKNGWKIKQDMSQLLMMTGSLNIEAKRIEIGSAEKEAFLEALKAANRFDVVACINGNVDAEFSFNDMEITPRRISE